MSLPSSASDPIEAPRPAGRPRVMGPIVWAVIAFGLVCLLVGAVAGVWGAKQFPATAGLPATSPPPAAAGAAPTAQPAVSPPAAAASAAAPAPVAEPADIGLLEDRLQRVERQHRSTIDAAAAALAAASLSQASETSRPFPAELEAAAALLPNSGDLFALRSLAAVGAPARSALSSDFDAMAARAAVASRAPAEGTGLLARAMATLSAMVNVRRVDRITGSDPDAVLARAERRLAEGDLESAVKELDALPPRGRDAASSWRAGAERRLQIERRLAGIRAGALRELTEARRAGSGA